MQKSIGIIGYGNMGSAIGQRLKSRYQIWAFDKDKNKTKNLSDIKIADNTADLVNRVNAVILAVKPQDFDTVLGDIKKHGKDKLIISIAAGITTRYIENKLDKIRVIRVMPNLPAKVTRGMIVLCKGNFASDIDLDFARQLFDYLGTTMFIEEDLMNAATAISGSGPGFFYNLIKDKPKADWQDYARIDFIPALSASAQKTGFSPEQAKLLARITTEGSIALLEETGLSPKELCSQVTSKGGTTEAGLRVLYGIDYLQDSVVAAMKRAEELSRG
jgi:pyrroline-5-carboxylate reductase